MSFAVVQFLNGLASASSLFLIASGLSIVFGVTRIINFAHGSFYMLGAYIAYSIVARSGGSALGFWGAVVVAALAVGVVGIVVEVLVLRRIYRAPELFQLLATFGVVLVVQDATRLIWGGEDLLGPRAPGLDGAVSVLGSALPEYEFALIALGPAVLCGLWLLFNRTRWGLLVRAATEDREMAAALGVDRKILFTGVFFLGAVLAGLGGALQVPRQAASLNMDMGIIVEAFVVVVVGGMGSIVGAFLAAVLVSELLAFGIVIFPQITLVLLFAVMAVVLVFRPWGLLGQPEAAGPAHRETPERPLREAGPRFRVAALVLIAFLAALPTFAGDYALVLATEMLTLALFAASLHFIMGGGGMVSFGHAAYFGLGAYAAALFVHHLDTPMEVALALAPLAAGLGGLVFGWFCVRLSGIYLAMLTLAFAQITWSVAMQWIAFTGGDNGILGVWPAPWASGRTAFYYLTLVLAGGGIFALRFLHFAPFGLMLRAARDSPLRAAAIGVDVRLHRWLGFALAGAFAGLAGGLFAFSKGSVFPESLAITRSVDALVMVLLGGLQTLGGPLVGAFAFIGFEDAVKRIPELADVWRLILGGIVLVLVLAFPAGIAGFLARATERIR
ncbi:MAG: ABC transporter permease [Rhodospirillales bacterium]|nr:ABC transporter permease [Rhodospirillales bacterium]